MINNKIIFNHIQSDVHTPKEPEGEISSSGTPKAEGSVNSASEGLRRRFGVHSNNEEKSRDTIDSDQSSAAVKLDDAARTHIEKHRCSICTSFLY
uniref:Ca2+ antiporter/cation exchanger n=1 Tax=Solanum tuberosum TaxID=4113 RepID=M1AKL8_SOLTU